MATKTPNVDEVLGKAQETARKTRELLREAEVLHNNADAAHRKAERLHGNVIKSRQDARDRAKRREDKTNNSD